MKNIFSIVILILIAIALIPACDIIEEPYLIPVGGNDTTPIGENVRKVLLEDYTGQKCPNCPSAAEIAQALKSEYGEKLVIIAVHAGFYAEPDPSGDFTTDFRVSEGTELNSYFSIAQYGYPMGMINRSEYDGFPVVEKDDWQTAVALQAEMDAQAMITITPAYNAGIRKLDCALATEFLEDLDGTFNICAFIVESGIISPQQTKDSISLFYEHNHMLRGSFNGTWGDPVGADGKAVSGTILTNNYSITLPAEWNADNCAVAAFIYDTETLEVVQAEEKEF
jgi:thiol-disulfide isomerase/thioredoxin